MVEDEEEFEDDDSGDSNLGLAHWLEEHYVGDVRFETVEINQPGQLDGEDFRPRSLLERKAALAHLLHRRKGVILFNLEGDAERAIPAFQQFLVLTDAGNPFRPQVLAALAEAKKAARN